MSFAITYLKEIVAFAIPFVAWALSRFFRSKATLILGNPHKFFFIVQQPLKDMEGKLIADRQNACTSSYVIQNTGSEPAKNVELVFNWKPMCVNIWPSRHYEEHIEADGRYALIFASLAPSELIGLELLVVNANMPDLITARSEQCIAKQVEMSPAPVVKVWKKRLAIVLLVLGASTSIYIVLLGLQYLILRTPIGPY
jgi:hypothetical protein